MNKKLYFLISAVCVIILSCCRSGPAGVPAATPEIPAPTLKPSASPAPTITATPSATPVVILEAEPLVVEFAAEDGAPLTGIYYPASDNPAPIIILFHWAQGDMTEWEPVALWLQNRGQLIRTPDYNDTWKSSDWFPENSFKGPLGVFVFTLRNCEDGCRFYQPEEWLLDIEAAMNRATNLQGVDPARIMTAGASIGADGALYGCAWLNRSGQGSCLGSFSLSPGSLLTIPYDELAGELISADPPRPVYCLYGLRDDASVETCTSLPDIYTVDFSYTEKHGLELIQPGQNPDPLELLFEFVQTSLAGVGK